MTAWQALLDAAQPNRSTAEFERPQLRAIRTPARQLSPVAFAGVIMVVVAAGLIGLLTLTTHIQNQAFELQEAQARAAELGYRVSDLEAQVSRANSPAMVAGRASELGMVPNTSGAFIDLAAGTVVGEPKPMAGNEMPALRVPPVGPPPAAKVQPVNSSVLPWADLNSIAPAPAPATPAAKAPAKPATPKAAATTKPRVKQGG